MFVKSVSFFLLALELAGVTAVPVDTRSSKGTFSVHATAKQRRSVRNGPKAMLKALSKHNLPIPEGLANLDLDEYQKKLEHLHSKRQSVTNTPTSWDIEYICPVNIGGQTLNLDFDTGSADLWTYSSSTPSYERAGHHYYRQSSSRTYRRLYGYSWNIGYADGSGASGFVGTDSVSIGPVKVNNQAIELATSVSSQFVQDTSSDGLLGLAFSNINTVSPRQQKTWMENALPSLKSPIFAANLKHNAPGTYDFGFINNSSYNGTLAYAPVITRDGYWEFNAPSYSVGGVNHTQPAGSTAIADTGTTLLLTTGNTTQDYFANVPGAFYDTSSSAWVYPCASTATLPALNLTIGNNVVSIPGNLFNFGAVDNTNCYSALQSTDGTLGVYGDIYFKAYYTVFDYGSTGTGPRLGFGRKY